jgi:urease accessory protein
MNARFPLKTIAAASLSALVPALASAHPGHDVGQDFVAGMMHPLSGLDHVLMIVAISAWASLLRPAGRVVVAACLASFVAAGALLPLSPASGAVLEAAIAATVVGAGMLLAIGRRWPLWASGTVAALFATIHGFAHGAEGPAQSLGYVPGLAIATAGLALAVSFMAARLQSQRWWLQAAGAMGAVFGMTALFSN